MLETFRNATLTELYRARDGYDVIWLCVFGTHLGLHRTPEGLETDLRPRNDQTRGYSGVGRQGRMFLLCYSLEGHELLLATRNNPGLLAIEIDKLHDRF